MGVKSIGMYSLSWLKRSTILFIDFHISAKIVLNIINIITLSFGLGSDNIGKQTSNIVNLTTNYKNNTTLYSPYKIN